MAKKSKIAKHNKIKAKYVNQLKSGVKPTKPARLKNICSICGKTRGYFRLFDMCRICLKFKIRQGEVAGVRKSSW